MSGGSVSAGSNYLPFLWCYTDSAGGLYESEPQSGVAVDTEYVAFLLVPVAVLVRAELRLCGRVVCVPH